MQRSIRKFNIPLFRIRFLAFAFEGNAYGLVFMDSFSNVWSSREIRVLQFKIIFVDDVIAGNKITRRNETRQEKRTWRWIRSVTSLINIVKKDTKEKKPYSYSERTYQNQSGDHLQVIVNYTFILYTYKLLKRPYVK